MTTIIIPEIDFRQANIRDAIDFLHRQSVEHDPNAPEKKMGVGVILSFESKAPTEPRDTELMLDPFADPEEPPPHSGVHEITFSARNVTVLEALDTICREVGLDYRIDRNGILSFRER